MGTRDLNDCLQPVQLTVDLKPNLPIEIRRRNNNFDDLILPHMGYLYYYVGIRLGDTSSIRGKQRESNDTKDGFLLFKMSQK
ncbi:putative protein phosphatase 2C 33 [Platanthera guangdongensis]|uniref:Uncharacterized protein n=1 Tax=Platanthera guangdongensis TaxID=2320717 RepID=A0ABR2LLH3_9ASPA